MVRLPSGSRFVAALAAAACLLSGFQAEGRPRHHRILRGCCGDAPNADPFDTNAAPAFVPEEAPSFLPSGPGSEIGPPIIPDASPVPGPAPYPQGFALDVPVTARGGDGEQEGEKPRAALVRYRQVADALAACWNPPPTFEDRPWKQVTLRVSFKRDGAIQGVPRILFADQGLTPAARSGLTRSLAAALQRCTPLPFSPGLGGAVAGQVFALRFIEQDPD